MLLQAKSPIVPISIVVPLPPPPPPPQAQHLTNGNFVQNPAEHQLITGQPPSNYNEQTRGYYSDANEITMAVGSIQANNPNNNLLGFEF